jgi:hypothetical protein
MNENSIDGKDPSSDNWSPISLPSKTCHYQSLHLGEERAPNGRRVQVMTFHDAQGRLAILWASADTNEASPG